MTTHTITATGVSQCDAILECLSNRKGEWLSMPCLVGYSGSYNVHSRISDLRKRGHRIEHRNEHHGRQVRSFYRLT